MSTDDDRTSADHPTPRPDDLYRRPLQQLYPPLGFTDEGAPVFVPGRPEPLYPPTPSPTTPVDESSTRRDDAPAVPPPPPRRSERRLVGVLALLAVAALALFAITVGRSVLGNQDTDTATEPSIPVIITAVPTAPDTPDNSGPGGTAPGADGSSPAIGKDVIYQVTSDAPTTIVYVDGDGLRTMVGAPTSWMVTFVGNSNPLRILVLAGSGAATCTIKIGGQTVASDTISADSPRRTATCRA